tara:strand:- start:923 stop:2479 length:1557 start_codon:yes stop_codon:yes gene_type:complete
MSITKITTPELLDFPNDSISSANTSGTIIPKGYTALCTFPGSNANVALYTMDGNADDSCGSLNLTNNNSVTFTANSPWGGSYQSADFDGSNYLSYGVGLGASANRTRSLWINIDTIPGSFCTLIYIGDAGANENYEVLSLQSSGKVRFQGRYGAITTSEIETGSALSTGTWYHIAWVYEGSSQLLYLNGVLVNTCGNTGGSGTSTGTCPSVTNTLTAGITHIAAWRDGSTVYDGKIAQVRFYNQALTPGQIVDLYNESLTTYYRPTTSLNAGEFRYNEQLGYVEYYDSSNWQQIADEYISGQPTSCICNYPTNTTPIALYELNDLTDTCGSWSNATNVGSATFTSGKFGNALTLNGSSQYLTLSDTWIYSNNFSCSVWVYIHDFTPGSTSYPMVLGFWGSGSYAWFIEVDGTVPEFNAYMYGPALRIGSTSTLALNTWYHIVFTTSSTDGKKFYLNGVLEGNNVDTQDATTTTPNANFIGQSTWGSDYFDGQIDQLRFYNSVLTQTQVTELYNEVICN